MPSIGPQQRPPDGERQQAAVAALGQRAIANVDLDLLMQEAVTLVAQTLGVEYSGILELLPGGEYFARRASTGWNPRPDDGVRIPASRGSDAGFALLQSEPVVMDDARTETRFSLPPILQERGVVSGMTTVIHGRQQPFGILGAHTNRPRRFGADSVNFLQAIANVLAAAIERKRIEDAVLESEEKFRSIVETSDEWIWACDLEGRHLYCNPAIEQILGYRPDEILAQDSFELVHPEDQLRFGEVLQEAVRNERGWSGQMFRWRHKDGSYRHLHSNGVPFFDARGELAGFRGADRDITERIRTEDALRESELRTRLIVDTAQDAIVTMDAVGLVTDWNPQAEALLGWARDEALGRPLVSLIVPARFHDEYHRDQHDFRSTGAAKVVGHCVERLVLHRDGHEIPVELAVSPAQVGNSVSFSAFIRDIRARKAAEAELRLAKEAAEVAGRAKSEFLANMSHEIRTPMNGIIGMTELLLGTDLDAEQRDYAQTVQDSADALLTIINDILDFSKIEARKLELESVPFDLHDAVMEALQPLAARADAKGLELACHIHPDVRSDVVGDPVRLGQVLINLVGNAIKFTETGEVVVQVETEALLDHAVVLHCSVRDTGIGIAPEKQSVVFDAFEQAHESTTRRYGGTGLGLAISAQLVRMQGGRIWLESELHRGSTFHFTVQLGLHTGAAVPPMAAEPVPDVHDVRVLVVDDNATNRQILVEILDHWAMRPTAVDGGWAALAKLWRAQSEGAPFPLLLVDAHMPEMDGFDLVERIRRNPDLSGVAIMMLSSSSQSSDLARCKQLGISTYLTKPIRQGKLRAAVVASLASRPATGSTTNGAGGTPGAVSAASAGEPAGADAATGARAANGADPAMAGVVERRLHILLAEDNTVNQRLVSFMLSKRGHSVVIAENGRKAIAALDQESFDIVLMDVEMPEMNGYETATAIRERELVAGGHIPILGLTAHAMKGARERCLESGMDGYVSKPIQTAEFFAAIDALVPAVAAP